VTAAAVTGSTLRLETALPGGHSHSTYLARETRTGVAVVLKAGGDPARLAREAEILAALAGIPGAPCPHPMEAPRLPLPGHSRRQLLILRYVPGHHPRTLADYQAFGASLAILHNTPVTGALRAFWRPPDELLRPARILAATAAPGLAGLIDALSPPSGQPWTDPVLTHGDAAPANAVICHRHGRAVLIDFENATIAHPGLDIGRAVFLTDLAGAPAGQRSARIAALLTGYARHRALPDHMNWWIAAAGLQIAAWRHVHRARADVRPGQIALDRAQRWAGFPGHPR